MSVRCLFRGCVLGTSRRPLNISFLRAYSTQLPSDTENARSSISKALTSRLDRLQTSFLFAGQRLNDLTGYSGIEKLKQQIEGQEEEVSNGVCRVKEAKQAYDEAIRTRSESQREVNELLQRKNSWSSVDLERFTTLFRNDHGNSRAEEECQRALNDAEVRVDQARTELGNMILARYHEEQIWSDKIRRASTWGTWGLMGFNIFLFVVVQLALEPWKRQRLVGSFEEKVRKVVYEEREALHATAGNMQSSPQEEADEVYLTDADHAAKTFDHHQQTAVPLQIPSDSAELFLTDADHAAEGYDHTGDINAARRPIGSVRRSNLEHDATTSSTRPYAGLSTMLSIKSSWLNVRAALFRLSSRMHDLILTSRAARIFASLLSPQQSTLRVEDVTSACFASGLVGILIGIGFGRQII